MFVITKLWASQVKFGSVVKGVGMSCKNFQGTDYIHETWDNTIRNTSMDAAWHWISRSISAYNRMYKKRKGRKWKWASFTGWLHRLDPIICDISWFIKLSKGLTWIHEFIYFIITRNIYCCLLLFYIQFKDTRLDSKFWILTPWSWEMRGILIPSFLLHDSLRRLTLSELGS